MGSFWNKCPILVEFFRKCQYFTGPVWPQTNQHPASAQRDPTLSEEHSLPYLANKPQRPTHSKPEQQQDIRLQKTTHLSPPSCTLVSHEWDCSLGIKTTWPHTTAPPDYTRHPVAPPKKTKDTPAVNIPLTTSHSAAPTRAADQWAAMMAPVSNHECTPTHPSDVDIHVDLEISSSSDSSVLWLNNMSAW